MSGKTRVGFRWLAIAALALALGGCGGGGGGGGSTTGSGGGGGSTGGGTGGGTSGYSVGGYLVGLASGTSVVLSNNGTTQTVYGNGTFTFTTSLASFSSYSVTVATQPANGQTCAVMGTTGSGLVTYANITSVRVSCYSLFTFSGTGAGGWNDAGPKEANFWNPDGIAVDASGNVYVADATSEVIRKISPAGVATTLAGGGASLPGIGGYADGTGSAAKFSLNPGYAGLASGVALDSAGNLYVADTLNNAIRKVTPAGVVTTLAGGGAAGYVDGTGTGAQFNQPSGVAVDTAGNVYVADTYNQVIRKITPTGVVSTFAGTAGVNGTADGTGAAAQFSWPVTAALDGAGNLYVGQSGGNEVRKITSAGVVTTFATGLPAVPSALAVDAAGNVWVPNANYGISMVTPAGVVAPATGSTTTYGFIDGPPSKAAIPATIGGLAVDASNNVYVADFSGNKIRKLSTVPYSYSVNGYVVGLGSGMAFTLFNSVNGNTVTLSANGQFTLSPSLTDVSGAQSYNALLATQPVGATCAVVNGAGGFSTGDVLNVTVNCATVSTLAGSGTAGFTNGTGTGATFNLLGYYVNQFSTGTAVDAAGNVYVADAFNNVIRQITPAGVVSTYAGTGTAGLTNGAKASAQFNRPGGLAIDAAGNLYVGDTGNNVIRVISAAGTVSTLAGSGTYGYADSATASAVQFAAPYGVAVDASGNVYVADSANNRIRVVAPTGATTTLAGSGTWGYVNGSAAAAQFQTPVAVALDAANNVYVADSASGAIRKITTGGVVTTIAGALTGSQSVGTGMNASFNSPAALVVSAAGDVYVADCNNSAIRVVGPTGVTTTLAGTLAVTGAADGNGSVATFGQPSGLAMDAAGNLYVADASNNKIRKITP